MSTSPQIPRHVAIIMDGNGRWARQRGQERIFGHASGVESVRAAVKAGVRNGVRYLTLFAFSTENWGRPTEEVDGLMELMCKSIIEEGDEMAEQGVLVTTIGDSDRLSPKVREQLAAIKEKTAGGERMTLVVALNYSARWEITRMAQITAQKAARGVIAPEDIDQDYVSSNLCTAPYPDPDLLIRTSGECRLSNFLLWQLAYSELYFTDVFWPDFTEAEFDKALEEFARRERRFGTIK